MPTVASACRERFGRGTLEQTFAVLRRPRPALALRVQNALTSSFPRHDYHTALTAAELRLDAADARLVAGALATLSERLAAAGPRHQAEVALMRSLLLDWLMLVHEIRRPAPAA